MNGMVGEPCAARPQLDGASGEEPRAVSAGQRRDGSRSRPPIALAGSLNAGSDREVCWS